MMVIIEPQSDVESPLLVGDDGTFETQGTKVKVAGFSSKLNPEGQFELSEILDVTWSDALLDLSVISGMFLVVSVTDTYWVTYKIPVARATEVLL